MATVLVVDDVAANRELMAMLLSYRGHVVIEACDGAGALALAQSRHPDVVVSDVLMPGIDGLELVHRLRTEADQRTARAPVIFYTANYLEPETRPIAEACGVSQVVLRSADPRELLDAVDTALRNGPVEIDATSDDDFARAHAHAVNAKLVEKVRALRHTERRFEAMATASPVGIALLDAHGDAEYVNPRLADITGLDEKDLLGRGWLACLEPPAHAPALELIRGATGEAIEHRYRSRIVRADGAERWLRLHLRPITDADADLSGTVVMVDDVSDVVAAEERVRHEARQRQQDARGRDAERLDSLRRMAGGMAHDFNNLLGAMLGFLNLAVESITDEMAAGRIDPATAAVLLDDLAQATKGGKRATKLTEQLLAFGRREISQPVRLNLTDFLRAAQPALDDAAGPGVELELRPGDRALAVTVDPRPLERLLHILVRNAREAMPHGGRITVATGHHDTYAVVTVTDTGRGMPAEVLDRAFEPFFSTKPGSRTAGLGLPTAHGIVAQAGGELTLHSHVGEGTMAVIRLPATPADVGHVPQAPDSTGPADHGPALAAGHPAQPAADDIHAAGGGVAADMPNQAAARVTDSSPAFAPADAAATGQTVLLVDDEDDLREVTARFITKAGYRVLTAAGGGEALEVADAHPIDCLVTDVVMPGMDGRQLAHRFLARRPEAKVIFISGYAEALIDDQGRDLEPGMPILPKPFTGADISRALSTALART